MRNSYKILFGKFEEKRLLLRPRRRWEDDIKMELKEMRCGDVDWILLNLNRIPSRAVENTVMKL
jgi:hypothetical protein